MFYRIFAAFVVALAVLAGFLAVFLSHNRAAFQNLMLFQSFFMISIPILGFGALIKYICNCGTCLCDSCTIEPTSIHSHRS